MTTTSGAAVPARRVGRLRLAAVIVRAGLRSQLANRADFAMAVANGVTYQITVLLFATVIFSRFSSLGGWGLGEILLISSIRMLGHGLYMLFFGNLGLIPHLLREGRFEAFRTRPAPVLLQVFTYEAPINALGDLVVAGASLTVCLSLVDVTWSAGRAVLPGRRGRRCHGDRAGAQSAHRGSGAAVQGQ
ncbi:ABC-2 family transporter protein [Streptomyces sp. NPDC087226]|uniref:ABC-2 family transporter protein n=1 Tax=Streptomyces sp. NPDC087226 TaxID=3365771 RepID=UPI0038079609